VVSSGPVQLLQSMTACGSLCLTVFDVNYCRCAIVCWCNCAGSIISRCWPSRCWLQCVAVAFSQTLSRTVSTTRWAVAASQN